MDKVRSALNKHRKKILGMKNVVGVGVGYKEAVRASTGEPKQGIVVLVRRKLPENQLEAQHIVPKDLDGIVTDVIEVGDIRLLGVDRTKRGGPAQPGMSIGHYKITAGTFGAVVKDRKTGEQLILSNNHVLANSSNGRDKRAKLGDPILLPGPHDGGKLEKDIIGRLYRFQPVDKVLNHSSCPKAATAEFWANAFCRFMAPQYVVKLLRESNTGNTVDAALAKPENQKKLNSEILEIGKINGMAEAQPGMIIIKSGRTTGVTKGTVKVVNATVSVEMGDGTEAEFHDQILTSEMSQGGDSGALGVNEQRQAVGLLFAGSDKVTVFNKIQNVMDKLDITF
ncbi:hypothetical protein [Phosphitispora sp. TUW77]|uniref:hypothetical protein n=1 Tax=Phosphitispora sp. TUW77 TaxID=3152361 RepID=UPI003AB7EF76